jgi:hypothetical protein
MWPTIARIISAMTMSWCTYAATAAWIGNMSDITSDDMSTAQEEYDPG